MRHCHSERSEESLNIFSGELKSQSDMFRFAQHDSRDAGRLKHKPAARARQFVW